MTTDVSGVDATIHAGKGQRPFVSGRRPGIVPDIAARSRRSSQSPAGRELLPKARRYAQLQHRRGSGGVL